MGIDPQRAVAFETTAAGVEAARNARFELVVAIAEPAAQELLRRRGADRVAASLHDLLARQLRSTARR
jgi:beta-phosphoglucomutase-like phosphatase (HAD superfamily)